MCRNPSWEKVEGRDIPLSDRLEIQYIPSSAGAYLLKCILQRLIDYGFHACLDLSNHLAFPSRIFIILFSQEVPNSRTEALPSQRNSLLEQWPGEENFHNFIVISCSRWVEPPISTTYTTHLAESGLFKSPTPSGPRAKKGFSSDFRPFGTCNLKVFQLKIKYQYLEGPTIYRGNFADRKLLSFLVSSSLSSLLAGIKRLSNQNRLVRR